MLRIGRLPSLVAVCGALTGCLNAFDVPPDESGALAPCCHDLGHCVAQALVGREQAAELTEDSCAPALICVPDALASDEGDGFATCRSLLDAEGRCVPDCLPAVGGPGMGGASGPPTSGCPAHHVCAPCFDPLDGAATGVCELGADPGPDDDPVVFDDCCMLDGEARGACVPGELVPKEAAALPADTCSGEEDRCVPRARLRDPSAGPTPCKALGETLPGACVLECLLSPAQREATDRGSCTKLERCVPCELGGQPTGACL